MEKSARIFLAGHLGMVGSAILRRLTALGHANVITRNRRQLNLTRQADVEDFFRSERPTHVFLAAARVGGIKANNDFPADFIRDNLLIQTNVIDAAHRFGAEKLLFLGSSCIYPRLCPQPIKEEYLLSGGLEPTNQWYAVAKIAGIKLCQALRRQHGFRAISLLPTNLYGLEDNFDLLSSHLLPALIRKAHLARLSQECDFEAIFRDEACFGPIPDNFREILLKGRPVLPVWGDGSPRREFLHVDDLADACVFLMDNYDSEEPLNVGTGKDETVLELARRIAGIVGFSGEIALLPELPGGTPKKQLDVSRISALGWFPQIALNRGIADTYEWYRKRLSQFVFS
ncbi:MAG: GDP-L-fucose synthase [Deltaproteobacteria bacterium]|nr:GDP-L-fucose synthase [Deltaproteobacteria bacterium]